jgi:glyoxylase-like metal-dependent hydrolase (beta-lactamase superfamily II)
MATAAEPLPAELPLAGGRTGATVRLHPLLSGRMIGPEAWFLREEGRLAWRRAFGVGVPKRDWLDVPVPAFLVEHPSVGPILIDTGFHPSVAVNPSQNLGRLSRFAFKDVRMEPEQAVAAQLREKGIQPADVRVVVMTHLHIDHASAISEFPQATFVVSKAEWEAATSHGEFHGYVRRQFDHGFDYRLLDFDDPSASSFSGFGRSFDLFGDGSVRTVFTPGHTEGHMSVVLRLSDREVLVAGDAIYLRRTLENQHLPYRMADEHLFRRSLREIRQYQKETPDALIIPGHDWEAWHELDPVYGTRE